MITTNPQIDHPPQIADNILLRLCFLANCWNSLAMLACAGCLCCAIGQMRQSQAAHDDTNLKIAGC